MKKITLLLFALLVLSCSSDDDTPADAGYMKVLYLGTSNTPGQPPIYNIAYGTQIEVDQVITPVSQEVYNYYLEKFTEAQPAKPRWRGMITEDQD